MKKISIVVVEDNRLLRDGITSIIANNNDMKVAGSFGDPAKAMQNINSIPPDIVLLDLGLKNQSSLNFLKIVKKHSEGVKVIVMDLVPSEEDVLEFVQAGVSGFILKDATIDEFVTTIRTVVGGAKVLPNNLTDSLFSQIVYNAINETNHKKITEAVRMTSRERQVIDLVSDGLSNKEIANKLHLSPYTVKSHVHNILEKLTLHSRVQIANYAHISGTYNKKSE
jgi:DNA-binding NarL/FixJ family response regulator